MMVRPSKNNMHEFVAEENTCFFDICLPNYTADSLRRITYFKEINQNDENCLQTEAAAAHLGINPSTLADSTLDMSKKIEGLRFLEYYATPPKLPNDIEINDVLYRGELN